MPPLPLSSTSKQSRVTRRQPKLAPPPAKRASSDATSSSSSGDASDLDGDTPSSAAYVPDELDEPISYRFQNGDAVWVRTEDGEWIQGTVSGSNTRKGATREKEGLFFPVAFGHNARRYFAPLNGDIKPDNAEVRRLLSEGGWL